MIYASYFIPTALFITIACVIPDLLINETAVGARRRQRLERDKGEAASPYTLDQLLWIFLQNLFPPFILFFFFNRVVFKKGRTFETTRISTVTKQKH